jgi:enoyl-CoA hydratase/carnithine racemase
VERKILHSTQDVLVTEVPGQGGTLGVITLNRPAQLNSLNHDMIIAIQTALDEWRHSPEIKAVVIRAVEGRAFCAGGDIRVVYDRAKSHHPLMTEFFYDEYQLNRSIFHFPKPYIAMLDGFTMGGGVGVSLHGSHRVGTERLVFAMPETGIGFFPDVGGTYFLPRLTGFLGYYLGLTGARIKVDDCAALGLVTHKVHHEVMADLFDALVSTDLGIDAHAAVSHLLTKFTTQPSASILLQEQIVLDKCFAASNMEGIMSALQTSPHAICQQAFDALNKKSPTSLKVTLQALYRGKGLDFDECMQQEFRLVSRFLLAHDFVEGIRAVIVDKDQTPVWHPATLAQVDDRNVEKYFAPLSKELASL